MRDFLLGIALAIVLMFCVQTPTDQDAGHKVGGLWPNPPPSFVNNQNTYANEPAVGVNGRTFWPTDGFSAWIDNGTSWLPFGPLYPLTQPPAASNFTITKNGSTTCTITDNKGGLYFAQTTRISSDDSCLAYETIPLTSSNPYPYTLTVGFYPSYGFPYGSGSSGCISYGEIGLMVYESGTTKIEGSHFYADSNCAISYQYLTQTGVNGAASSAGGATAVSGYSQGGIRWMQIKDDGTNRYLNVSSDGVHWVVYFSHAHATNFTTIPDKAGLFLNARGMSVASQVISFSLTAP